MFNIFKSNPIKKLQKQYDIKLETARDAQRAGNIKLFAQLTNEAEVIDKQIDKLLSAQSKK